MIVLMRVILQKKQNTEILRNTRCNMFSTLQRQKKLDGNSGDEIHKKWCNAMHTIKQALMQHAQRFAFLTGWEGTTVRLVIQSECDDMGRHRNKAQQIGPWAHSQTKRQHKPVRFPVPDVNSTSGLPICRFWANNKHQWLLCTEVNMWPRFVIKKTFVKGLYNPLKPWLVFHRVFKHRCAINPVIETLRLDLRDSRVFMSWVWKDTWRISKPIRKGAASSLEMPNEWASQS